MINETDMLAYKIKKKLDIALTFLLNSSTNQWDRLSTIKKDYMTIYSEFNNISSNKMIFRENNKSRNINFSKFLDKKPIYSSDVMTKKIISNKKNLLTKDIDYSNNNKFRPSSNTSLKNNYKKKLNFSRVAYIKDDSYSLSQYKAVEQISHCTISNLSTSCKNKLPSFITAIPSEGPKKQNISDKINGGLLTIQKSPIKNNSQKYKNKSKSDADDNFNLSNHKRQYQQTINKSKDKLNLNTITSKNQYSQKLKLSEKFINVFKSNINTINTTYSNEYNQNTITKMKVNGINKEDDDKKRKEEEKRIFEKIFAENLLNRKIQYENKAKEAQDAKEAKEVNEPNEIKISNEIVKINECNSIVTQKSLINVLKEEAISEKSNLFIKKESINFELNKNDLEINFNNNELVQTNESYDVIKFNSDNKLVSNDIIPEINHIANTSISTIENKEKELELLNIPCQEDIVFENLKNDNIDVKSKSSNTIDNKLETETKEIITDPYESYLKVRFYLLSYYLIIFRMLPYQKF